MPRYRTVRLVLHLGRSQAHYALLLRTTTGQDLTDRRLSWGSLDLPADEHLPGDVLDLLQRCVWDLCRRHRVPPAAGGPGAPGGGGGRPDREQVETLPLFLISRDGQPLDADGNEI